jgi:TnsA endonuclease N terminal/TnsA endonuclease C terminal
LAQKKTRCGKNYRPWLEVTDVPPHGTCCVITGWDGREDHYLSTGERQTGFLYQWPEEIVVDSREQYPILPIEDTQTMAAAMGIEHPRGVVTVDFMLTIRRSDGELYYVSRDVKEMKELASRRTLEKLSLAHACLEIRGIEWGLVISDHEFPETEWRNVEWMHEARNIKNLVPLPLHSVIEIARMLSSAVEPVRHLRNLAEFCQTYDKRLNHAPGSCLKVVRFLLANKVWKTDMHRRIVPRGPIDIEVDNIKRVLELS